MTTLSEATTRKRKEYIQSLNAQIEQWGDEINHLEEETTRFSAKARLDYLEAFARLRKHRQQLRMNLDTLEETDDSDNWETTWLRCLEIVAEYKRDFQSLIRKALQDQAAGEIPPNWLQRFVDPKVIAAAAPEEIEPLEEL
jgi:hypothetical protein